MIYSLQVLLTFVLVIFSVSDAFRMLSPAQSSAALKMSLADYKEELGKTAALIAGPGKGILAVDESTKTIGKRLQSIGIENTEENRQSYRGLLFSAPGLGQYISGAILYEETLFQSDSKGKPFVTTLKENGIFPGIKVDTGLQPLPGADPIETWCTGLDGLKERAANYYAQGARFAKWRAVLQITDSCPSALSIQENAWGLARYARAVQESGRSDEIKKSLNAIINEKKKSDPRGYSKALNDNCLLEYLSADLRRAKINTSMLKIDKNGQISISVPSHTMKRNIDNDTILDYFDTISATLDDNLFEPYYQSTLSANHMNMAETMAAFKSSQKIQERLKNTKVVCGVSSFLLFSYSLYSLMTGNVLKSAFCFYASADLLRVSYNCYTKNYCSIFIRKYFGNVAKLGDTLFQMAKSVVGLTEPEDSPLIKLKEGIILDILMEDTLSKILYLKVEKFFQK